MRERYGVDPGQVVDFIALRGDGSDRIPGAMGVGPKKAASLLAQYGSLEAALDGRTLLGRGRQPAAVPPDRADGRRRAAARARRDAARLGGAPPRTRPS